MRYEAANLISSQTPEFSKYLLSSFQVSLEQYAVFTEGSWSGKLQKSIQSDLNTCILIYTPSK